MAHRNCIISSPIDGVGVDATEIITIEWEFIGDEEETQTSFRIKVYLSDDDTLVYDSSTQTSSLEYYDIPADSFTNGNTYFYTIETNDGSTSRTTRVPQKFITLSTPTVVITTPSDVGQFYTFDATYTQDEGVEAKTYQWSLYDSSDVLISEEDLTYGQTIEETITGFDDDTTYNIEVTVVNQKEVSITSDKVSFTTSYTIPSDAPEIIVTSRPSVSGNGVNWQDVVILNASLSTGDEEYVTGKFDYGLELTNQCLIWDLDGFLISTNFTSPFWIKLDSEHDGDFWKLYKDDEVLYSVGYDSDNGRFTMERDYRYIMSIPVTIPTGWFLIGVTPDTVYFYSDESGASFDTFLR